MPVLISFFFLAVAAIFSALVWNSNIFKYFSGNPIRELIAGHYTISYAVVLLIALIAFVISFVSMFRVRNSTMVVGSKKILMLITVLSLILVIFLGYRLYRSARPFVIRYTETLSSVNTNTVDATRLGR